MSGDRLKSRIEAIRGRIEVVLGRGEEATKQALVLPMLDALGYDIWNPAEVCPEFDADFATRRGAQPERVDLAVLLGDEPRIFIEVKSVDTKLDNHHGQLSRYFNAVPTVSLAVLTNGREYRFFTDTGEPNRMDDRPFHVANLESVDLGVDVLTRFSKPAFSTESVRGYASDLIYTAKLVAFLKGELDLRNGQPSDDLIRWVLASTNMYDGRIVSSVVERFQPLVKNALQMVMRDIVRRSVLAIDRGIGDSASPAEVEPVSPATDVQSGLSGAPTPVGNPGGDEGAGEASETRGRRGIVTTDDELRAYAIVRSQFERSDLATATVIDPATRQATTVEIAYKDTTGYFGIYLNKPSWWAVRLNLDARVMWAGISLPPEIVEPLLPPGVELLSPNAFAPCRVKLDDIETLNHLGPVILAAMNAIVSARQAE